MTTALTLPQARIPIGTATIQGQQVPIFVTIDWMLAFAGLLSRSGGTSGDTSFEQYINQFYDLPPSDPALQESVRAIDELRQELASSRAELQSLRSLIDDQTVQLAQMRSTDDFRSLIQELLTEMPQIRFSDDLRTRVEQIEGRLQ